MKDCWYMGAAGRFSRSGIYKCKELAQMLNSNLTYPAAHSQVADRIDTNPL